MLGFAVCWFVSAGVGQLEELIPNLKGSTPLALVKASPREYADRSFIIAGTVRLGKSRDRNVVVIELREFGAEAELTATETAMLRLRKDQGQPLVNQLTALAKRAGAAEAGVAARALVRLSDGSDASDWKWNVFELENLQFADRSRRSWEPWILQPIAASDELPGETPDRKTAKKSRPTEPAKPSNLLTPREWFLDNGTDQILATYRSVINNAVRVETLTGSTVDIDISRLSPADKEYLKSRDVAPIKVLAIRSLATGDLEVIVKGSKSNADYVRKAITAVPDASATDPVLHEGKVGSLSFIVRGSAKHPLNRTRLLELLERDSWVDARFATR